MTLLEAATTFIGSCESLGTHRPIIDTYNTLSPLPRGYRMNYSDSWCMAFVSVCAMYAGKPNNFPYECSCGMAIEKLKKEGLWKEDDRYVPRPNDLIFYHWGKDPGDECTAWPDHVGIVVKVEDGLITVIEGNYNDRVARRDIAVGHRYIRGYGLTSYIWDLSNTDINIVANQVINGKWGNMPERKGLLEAAGYDYWMVQTEVNRIYMDENPADNEDLLTVAMEVIRGAWGNNPERKKALIKAGYDYDAVMDIVNDYYRKEDI